jgi:hypothetical protein
MREVASRAPTAWILVAGFALAAGCSSSGKSASPEPDGSLGSSSDGSSGGSPDDGSPGSYDASSSGSSDEGSTGATDASSGGLVDTNVDASSDAGGDTGSTEPQDGGTASDGGARADSGTKDAGSKDAGASGDGASPGPCVPTIPTISWTSPYAGWSRGIPTDPSFFPIAVWLQGSWHATELAGLGINIYVGNNAGTDSLAASDLSILSGLGMYAIIGQDSVGLASIDNPTVIGWWMTPDEPDNAQPDSDGGYGPPVAPSTLVTQYNAYKAADSTRPIWLGLGQGVAYPNYEGRGSNPPAESGYVPASDIVSFDIYPYNNCSGDANDQVTCAEFWLNASGVDNLHQWSNRNQAVWSDFETTVINAGTTDGPTPTETASEVWLALIHSANGVLYFIDSWNPSFREDAIFENSDMVTAVTALNQEIQSLAPELNSATIPNLVTIMSSNSAAPVDTMVKANGTSLYVFSAISRAGTATASYTINGMTGNGVATVVGEGRTVTVTAGRFSDAFAANGVHIYTIDLATASCN